MHQSAIRSWTAAPCRVEVNAQEEESMTTAPDPGRIKAICKQRHQWYTATCVLVPLGFVGCFQRAAQGPHGHASPLVLAAALVGVAALVIGDLIWRCPACKVRLPRGFAPAPLYCPQCAVPLGDPSERAFAGSKEARRFVWGLLGFLVVTSLMTQFLAPPRRHRVLAAGSRSAAPVFTRPTEDDLEQFQRQIQVVDRLLAARFPGACLHGTTADLVLLQRLLDRRGLKPTQTYELQCVGVAFGNVLAREAGLHWIMVTDEYGHDPALQYQRSSLIVFPLTMISKRVEAGEPVDLARLLAAMRALVKQHAREADPAPSTA
jgi:uncharacterized protein DUF3806